LLVTPATKSKSWGQKGTVKMSGCNRLWSVCAADATGPVSRDAGEQSAGATPRRRGALLPHAQAKITEGSHGEGYVWQLWEKINRQDRGVSGASLALMGNDDRSSGCGNGIVADADADG
jgi:hypothetical protein